MNHWLLLTSTYVPETLSDCWDHREFPYKMAPKSKVKRGDTVFLWHVSERYLYGWGLVSGTPFPSETLNQRDRGRLVVPVTRSVTFDPPLTRLQIERDRSLAGMIPDTPDDLCGVPLQTHHAYRLNDVIRTYELEPPPGSSSIAWYPSEPGPDGYALLAQQVRK
jgi:hypothetical protein